MACLATRDAGVAASTAPRADLAARLRGRFVVSSVGSARSRHPLCFEATALGLQLARPLLQFALVRGELERFLSLALDGFGFCALARELVCTCPLRQPAFGFGILAQLALRDLAR